MSIQKKFLDDYMVLLSKIKKTLIEGQHRIGKIRGRVTNPKAESTRRWKALRGTYTFKISF